MSSDIPSPELLPLLPADGASPAGIGIPDRGVISIKATDARASGVSPVHAAVSSPTIEICRIVALCVCLPKLGGKSLDIIVIVFLVMVVIVFVVMVVIVFVVIVVVMVVVGSSCGCILS